MDFIEILKAIFLGIVEGITEWLPISSTGHMILVDKFIELNLSSSFKELFFVVIQLGAILAVPTLFFNKLNPFSSKKSATDKKRTFDLWKKVIVGAIPAGAIGFMFDDLIESLLYSPYVIAAALIVYGIAFIVIERLRAEKSNDFRVNDVSELTYKDALKIGAFQVLSLVPGTSRSGATILGGMLSGVSRVASAEFSFFMAIPIMIGASCYKLLKFIIEGVSVSGMEIAILLIGIAVAYAVSLFCIKFLIDFVKRHSFSAFGVYRIILGIVVIGYFLFAA